MTQWYCLNCGHALTGDEPCPLPACVDRRIAAEVAMGLRERRPPVKHD